MYFKTPHIWATCTNSFKHANRCVVLPFSHEFVLFVEEVRMNMPRVRTVDAGRFWSWSPPRVAKRPPDRATWAMGLYVALSTSSSPVWGVVARCLGCISRLNHFHHCSFEENSLLFSGVYLPTFRGNLSMNQTLEGHQGANVIFSVFSRCSLVISVSRKIALSSFQVCNAKTCNCRLASS